jgi:hypothetical protein
VKKKQSEESRPVRGETRAGALLKFWLPATVLLVLALTVPWLATTYLGLDERTPQAIAEDTLQEEYDLQLVDASGKVLKNGSLMLTVSTFSMAPGSTTEHVPFAIDGKKVHCTVHMPTDDPRDVTADCS